MLPDHAETGIPEAERKARFSHKIDILTPEEIKGMRKVCKVSPNPHPSDLTMLTGIVGEGGVGYYGGGTQTGNNDFGIRSDLS